MGKKLKQDNSITLFRKNVELILKNEMESGKKRNVVIFALDGITYPVAKTAWKQPDLQELISVFPTTSSTGWISSLSGMTVDNHGIPGVIFKPHIHSNELINIFKYKNNELCLPIRKNIFSDAKQLGYTPLALLGDLEPFDCSWKDALLAHALQLPGNTFYPFAADQITQKPPEIFKKIEHAILHALESYKDKSPCLLWCFINIDHHIHMHGYDEHVYNLLELLEGLAINLLNKKNIVLAHSDHGLTKTTHDKEIATIFEHIKQCYPYQMGGAGRTRWIYTDQNNTEKFYHYLKKLLPPSIQISFSSEYFNPNSLAGTRVGNLLLIAKGEEFIIENNYSYEHGSLTKDELSTPFAQWFPEDN